MLDFNENAIKILDRIIDEKGCPFLDNKCVECHPDCACRMYDNTKVSCYEIAKNIKNSLKSKKGSIQ